MASRKQLFKFQNKRKKRNIRGQDKVGGGREGEREEGGRERKKGEREEGKTQREKEREGGTRGGREEVMDFYRFSKKQ